MQQYTWIFSLRAPLNPDAKAELQKDLDTFTGQWKSHGTPVEGLIQVKRDQFIIVQADPSVSRPSGCSIDSLRRGVDQILKHHGLEVLTPASVGYEGGGGEVTFVDFREIPQYVKEGKLHAQTRVFDNTLSQSDDLALWEQPLEATWLKRYL
ncbi:MAG: hypothetical protein AAFR59_02930 [Bacteroidota bacterium]